MERQDNRPRVMQQGHSSAQIGPKPPTIQSDYPVTYWSDTQIGTSGLKNLGITCYMNATIQCLSATVPFARFFTDGRWRSAVNMVNPMGTKGNLAHAFADILHEMWQGDLPYLTPYNFRRSITGHASQFGGSDQHDSQEFLSFLLDGLHEDLNRILHKPTWQPTAEREAELERLPQQIASDQEWKIYRMRNDSLIVDFFQGQFRNRLECLTCHKTSTTYNSFMYLTLPVPTGRGSSKVTLTQCLDAFVKSEVMEKTDAWHCPNCRALRRATKQLSLSRLPPVLLIHLKRFQVKGPFTDKIETLVDFPLRSLDLTNYMPPPLPPGVDKSQLNGGHRMSSDDPRAQLPPYRYDLYGVTNHSGNLSNGHYTAFIASRGGWLYCDDSRVQPTDAREVVGRRAYVLFYKRSRS
jgi:ubiquitin carboxyl-terminal hydrolase 8